LVVHGRTRAQGYKPPAYWARIADVRGVVDIPVVANGEIWTVADAQRCRAESGCHDLMLGRGMVSDPGLAWDILAADGLAETGRGPCWADLQPLFHLFWGASRSAWSRATGPGASSSGSITCAAAIPRPSRPTRVCV
jgi:tRNA-dihydrouridine synthase C